jgi:PIN domain nuclease of toxin-antitoxin system
MGSRGGREVKAILDTHILVLWVSSPESLSPAQRHIVEAATSSTPLLVADISLWEIATLVSLGRLALDRPPRDWLERAVALPLVRRIGITPAVAAAVADLPETFHRDPADRIIVATALVMGAAPLPARPPVPRQQC